VVRVESHSNSKAFRSLSRKPSSCSDPPKILIYGFGPYGYFASNITENAIKKLAARKGLRKMVFPVRFNKRQFTQAVKNYQPDVILGLGQCSAGRRLRIELRAFNRRRQRPRANPVPIAPAGARWLETTLQLDFGREATVSRKAGSYVCNYSMYVMLDYLRRNRSCTRFGFIHVPYDFNTEKITRYLERVLGRIYKSFSKVPDNSPFTLHTRGERRNP
jgi:pyroglutamyl-peptidase